MTESLDEIMARHDALTACGCSCCDDDYCAYVERQNCRQDSKDAVRAEDPQDSSDSQRKSLRYIFEWMRGRTG